MHCHSPLLALSIVLGMASASVANNLSGRVTDSAGQPLPNATVMVSTAAPRKGVAVFCPSCYADCGKKAVTDAEGKFAIPQLDSSLVFYVAATAEGHRARISKKVDPAKDTAEIALDALPADLPPARLVRGRVVDSAGKPVVGAQVSPYGCRNAKQRWWGSLPGVDQFSITNGKGEFIITSKDDAEAFDIEVRSPRNAPKRYSLLPTGDKPHELTVEAGGMVRGRLVKAGLPISGVSVGLVQTDRSSERFLGPESIGTNAKGEFTFSMIAPGNDYYIYTLMDSMRGAGSLPLRRITIDKTGTLADVGEVELADSHTLSGQIVLSDGTSLKGPIQLLASREGAWDSQRAMVGADGKFRFENMPDQEPISLIARVPGYHLTQQRNHFQLVRDTGIALFVERPRDDIKIVYEPAPKK
jgi:hypothetical protein